MDTVDIIGFPDEVAAELAQRDQNLLQQEWEERDAVMKLHGHDEFTLVSALERLMDKPVSMDTLEKVFAFAERHVPSAKNNPKLDPDSAEFNALATSKYLHIKILSFNNPGGLIAYWRGKKVQQRLHALPDGWRIELNRRYVERVDAINDHGPDLIQ